MERVSLTTRTNLPILGVAVLLIVSLLAVLPSSLTTPQANPSETAEYAPVPPDDDSPPSQTGNLSSLGLAGSSSLSQAAQTATSIDDAVDGGSGSGRATGGRGTSVRTKRCVGNPARQTEDPLSPPCVAHFDGNNFGATTTGVTGQEIKVLFYLNAECDAVTSRGTECPPSGYHDLGDPPEGDEHYRLRTLRVFQRYYNDRYQTYGRTVRFILFFASDTSSCNCTNPETRKADAAANYARVKPFAVVSSVKRFSDPYIQEMAKQGAMVFGSLIGQPDSFFREFPKHIWSVQPSIEQQAELFAAYVCKKVIPHKVSFSGNPNENGKDRKFGLLYSTDQSKVGFIRFTKAARSAIEKCGGKFAAEGSYPVASIVGGTRPPDSNASSSNANMAKFQQEGVTTVIWPQGYETEHTKAAERLKYFPEWVMAGDTQFEGYQSANFQSQPVTGHHSWVVTQVPLSADDDTAFCYQSQKEADPDRPETDARHTCSSSTYYDDLRLLFTGIQASGPRLTIDNMDRGFRAIPAVRSTHPSVPACFFEPGDYTCVKDAAAAWWDETAPNEDRAFPNGCWRYAEKGQRHFARDWPDGDVLAQQRPDDTCSRFAGSANR